VQPNPSTKAASVHLQTKFSPQRGKPSRSIASTDLLVDGPASVCSHDAEIVRRSRSQIDRIQRWQNRFIRLVDPMNQSQCVHGERPMPDSRRLPQAKLRHSAKTRFADGPVVGVGITLPDSHPARRWRVERVLGTKERPASNTIDPGHNVHGGQTFGVPKPPPRPFACIRQLRTFPGLTPIRRSGLPNPNRKSIASGARRCPDTAPAPLANQRTDRRDTCCIGSTARSISGRPVFLETIKVVRRRRQRGPSRRQSQRGAVVAGFADEIGPNWIASPSSLVRLCRTGK